MFRNQMDIATSMEKSQKRDRQMDNHSNIKSQGLWHSEKKLAPSFSIGYMEIEWFM